MLDKSPGLAGAFFLLLAAGLRFRDLVRCIFPVAPIN